MRADEQTGATSRRDRAFSGVRPGAIDETRRVRMGSVRIESRQRVRMLRATAELVFECGYAEMSVGALVARAGVSRTTFYDYFEGREDCFLAAFDDALARLAEVAVAAYDEPGAWSERLRSAIEALLRFLEGEPALGSLVFADAGGLTRATVIERRARALEKVVEAVEEGRSEAGHDQEALPLTATGVVGGAISVVAARLAQRPPGELLALAGPLTGMIVLPYLGWGAAKRELRRPARKRAVAPKLAQATREPEEDPIARLPVRATYRTLMVLTAIHDRPGASSRDIAAAAGISDEGQTSKLLARLERLELVQTSAQWRVGERHRWRLTPRGREVERALSRELRPSER
jgi:AcrR family transcriptional regulator